jgi:putative esterase
VLKGNPLNDPTARPLWVYLPPGCDADATRRYPSIYVIQGLTGQVDMWRNRQPFRPNFPELTDAQFAAGGAPLCILIYVDCWTSLGGSQYLDSAGTGRYHTYLCDEIVPWVDHHYRTLAEVRHRGIMGKSSGGYGAMVTPMLRPDLFGGLATHAGDALFELSYANEFPKSVRTLRDKYHSSYDEFWKDFHSRPAFSKEGDAELLNDWCMAACYSADADGTVRLPFDPQTGKQIPEVWERWLRWGSGAHGFPTCRRAPLDAGDLHRRWQTRRILARSRRGSLSPRAGGHRRDGRLLELFDATHDAIEYRYPIDVKYLAERLSP